MDVTCSVLTAMLVNYLLLLFLTDSRERSPMPRTWLLRSILLAVLSGRALCQGYLSGLFRIDCGAQTGYYEDFTYWNTDEKYITTGDNTAIPLGNLYNVTQLNSLRYFKKRTRNCYTLPAAPSQSYNVKASFYYGNYDGRSSPPTFGLEIEGIKWADVMTSSTGAVYHEVIYTARRYNISVCLVPAKGEHGHPFINALETAQLSSYDMYDQLNRDLTWFRRYRYSFGADGPVLGYPDDSYNRVWEANTPQGIEQVTSGATLFYYQVNGVPITVLNRAVEALSPNDSVILQLTFDETDNNGLYYLTFYFTSMHYDYKRYMGRNSFDMSVGDSGKATVDTDYLYCTCWTLANVHLNGMKTLSIELHPNRNTSFPPAISAMEVFEASMASPNPGGPDEKKGKDLGLLVGLPVGLVLGLTLLGLCFYFLVLRRPRPIPGRPVPHVERAAVGDAGQGFDQEELNELLYLHFAAKQVRNFPSIG